MSLPGVISAYITGEPVGMPAQQRQPMSVPNTLTLRPRLHEGLKETGSASGGGGNNDQYLHRMVGEQQASSSRAQQASFVSSVGCPGNIHTSSQNTH